MNRVNMQNEWIQRLRTYVTPERMQRFQAALGHRTRLLTVVLEDVYQSHNMSACLRSCDCFGVQEVHVIENKHDFEIIPEITRGAGQWLSVHRYNRQDVNTGECLRHLREQGFEIVGASPHNGSEPLEQFELTHPAALVFGTELYGLSAEARAGIDRFLHIPMMGLTESLNVSTAVAICLHHLTWKLRQSSLPWKLTEPERQELLIHWMRTVVRKHWGDGLDERIQQELRREPV